MKQSDPSADAFTDRITFMFKGKVDSSTKDWLIDGKGNLFCVRLRQLVGSSSIQNPVMRKLLTVMRKLLKS
jgi:hypothetical protein